jgi:hypothetical protein
MPAPLNLQLTGQTFGDWTVIADTRRKSHGHHMWLCRCACGTEKEVSSLYLRNGRSRNCGCKRYEILGLRCLVDHAGKTFGKWTVIERAENNHHGQARWLCRCTCGVTKAVDAGLLAQGKSQGCGCKAAPGAYAKSIVLRGCREGATKRNLPWELTNEYALDLMSKNCFYCGAAPSNHRKTARGDFRYNGIDRVDNSLGYLSANCVPSCFVCNNAKGTRSYEDFFRWILRIAARSGDSYVQLKSQLRAGK